MSFEQDRPERTRNAVWSGAIWGCLPRYLMCHKSQTEKFGVHVSVQAWDKS